MEVVVVGKDIVAKVCSVRYRKAATLGDYFKKATIPQPRTTLHHSTATIRYVAKLGSVRQCAKACYHRRGAGEVALGKGGFAVAKVINVPNGLGKCWAILEGVGVARYTMALYKKGSHSRGKVEAAELGGRKLCCGHGVDELSLQHCLRATMSIKKLNRFGQTKRFNGTEGIAVDRGDDERAVVVKEAKGRAVLPLGGVATAGCDINQDHALTAFGGVQNVNQLYSCFEVGINTDKNW